MKLTTVFMMALTLLYGVIAVHFFRKYLILQQETGNHIAYELISAKVNRAGRGSSFDMAVLYQKQPYELSITSKDYRAINKGKYPKLYYSAKLDEVFYDWNIKMSLRIALIFFVFFSLMVFWYFKNGYRYPEKSR